MSFARTIENFICEKCGTEVRGTGYTNHCPHCLWSKHVDVNPGDRAEPCSGLMEPVGVETKSNTHTLMHRCTLCGFSRRQIISPEDDFEKILGLTTSPTPPRTAGGAKGGSRG